MSTGGTHQAGQPATTGALDTRARVARWRKAINWRAAVGILLIAAAAYQSAVVYHEGEVAAARAQCQAQVNGEFLDALSQRDVANRELTDAQRDLLTHGPTNDLAVQRELGQRYLTALNAQQASRDNHPLPPLRRC